jgi:L-alanine-DL-glutamate epimerase-like enolase superfamily enzyme
LENGYIRAPDGPGLGIKLLPDLKKRKDARIRISKL